MKNRKIPLHVLLFAIGIVLILISPYVPEALFEPTYKSSVKLEAVIPAIRTTGILISVYGIVLKMKEEK